MSYYIKTATHASAYSKFRPTPPQMLVEKIIEFIKEKISEPLATSIDIGCGSGQSTKILSPYFQKVIGIDNNDSQIELAQSQNITKNISYRLGSAENFLVEDASVQLVTACQCAHWFDIYKFYEEVSRVLQPEGVLALYVL
uniref:Methyltransferase type 11 domain-containing protein n=1 Tax=Clastoptera arizonana TaxID=38151 RepID=A0A1B6CRP2_9HEMI